MSDVVVALVEESSPDEQLLILKPSITSKKFTKCALREIRRLVDGEAAIRPLAILEGSFSLTGL